MGQGLMNCNVTDSDVYLHELICMGGRGREPVGWRKKETEKINSTLFDPSAHPRCLHWSLREKGCLQSLKEVFLKGTCKTSGPRLGCFHRDDAP